jgi:hypothetical protein
VEEVCERGPTDQQVAVTTFSGMLFVASTVSESQEAIEVFGREVIPNFPEESAWTATTRRD